MAAPKYQVTNYFGTTDPAGDIITLIENQLTLTEWVFVEAATFTQASTARVMRVWKNPAALNAAGTDFYVGLVKNTVAGTYLAFRVFEGWNTTTKTMQRPALQGSQVATVAWSSAIYNGSLFAVVGQANNTLMTSPDAITWTARLLPVTGNWGPLAYGGGQFVTVIPSTTTAATSPDGVTWTQRTLSATSAWTYLAYGNGVFVLLSLSAVTSVLTSPDGITWTTQAETSQTYTGLTFGAGLFVATIGSSTIRTSPDGITWTNRTATGVNATNVTYGNGTFLAVSVSSTTAATSPDGITWTARTLPLSSGWRSMAYGNGVWVVLAGTTSSGLSSDVATSTDAITWVARTMPTSAVWTGLTFGNGLFTAVNSTLTGPGVYTSPDGITWTARNTFGSVAGVGISDYALAPITTPSMVEAVPTTALAVTTNYDVGVLVSKSYLAIAVNTNTTTNQVFAMVLGLYAPAYTDPQAGNPPLMALVLNSTTNGNGTTSGVSRSMRVPFDSQGGQFAVGVGAESILLGFWNNATKEPVTQSVRAARAVLVTGSTSSSGYVGGGVRGWLYDCVVVATNPNFVGTKVGDTVTIGANVYSSLGQASAANAITINPSSFATTAFFFNTAAGS